MAENKSNAPYEAPPAAIIEREIENPVDPIPAPANLLPLYDPVPALDPLEELLEAIRNDDFITAERLIEDDDLDINQYDQHGLMPVHYLGVHKVSEELFSLICQNTEDPLITTFIESDYGIGLEGLEIFHNDNVLHIAARSSNNYISANFQHRFNYISTETNSEGNTPMIEAISCQNTEMVDFMLKKGVVVSEADLELAEDFLGTKDASANANSVYRKLALSSGIKKEIIEEKIHAIEKFYADDELSDKDSADSEFEDEDQDQPSPTPASATIGQNQTEQGNKTH